MWIMVLVSGCHHPAPGPYGIWHIGPGFEMVFEKNGEFYSRQQMDSDSVSTHHGVFTSPNDSVLFLAYQDIPDTFTIRYTVKGDILRLAYPATGSVPGPEVFLHRSDQYPEYHIWQLYHYGEIRDTSRDFPAMHYFQF